MSKRITCILCEMDAEESHIQGKDGYLVECRTCGKYFLASPEMFEKSYTEEMPREKKRMLASYTRNRFELTEELPTLENPDNFNETITEYENKSDDQRLENLIWYLRKKSPQFGDGVLFDAGRDYPIVYGLEANDFLHVVASAIDKGLIHPVKGRYEEGLKLTSKGWHIGTELMKSSSQQ
jgi:hypothetical protein